MSLFTEFKAELVSFIKDTYEQSYKDNNVIMSKRRSDDVCKLLKIIYEAKHPIMLKNEILAHMGTLYEQTAFIVRVAYKLGIDSSKLHKGLKKILDDKRFDNKNLKLDYAIETRNLAEQIVENSEKYKELQVQHEQLGKTIKDFIEKLQIMETQVKKLEEKNKAQAERIKELETGVAASYEPHVSVEVNTRIEDERKIQDLEFKMREYKNICCSLTQQNNEFTLTNSNLVLEKNKLEEEVAKKNEEIKELKLNNQQLAQNHLTLLKGNQDGKIQTSRAQVEAKHTYAIAIAGSNKPTFWSRLFNSSDKKTAEPIKTYATNSNICFIE